MIVDVPETGRQPRGKPADLFVQDFSRGSYSEMVLLDFHYNPGCSAPGCALPAVYKIAASWSDGASWELKHYGLACESHRLSQLARGQLHREGLILADGEVVGQVGIFELRVNARDAELKRLPDHE